MFSAEKRAAIMDEVCERLSKGEPLSVICRDIGIGRRTIHDWRESDPEFFARYDEAKDLGYDAIAKECLEIADTLDEGVEVVDKNGMLETRRGDMLGHRKLRIETRLKLLAKWDPRRYGDKMQQEISGELTTRYANMSDEAINERIAALTERKDSP